MGRIHHKNCHNILHERQIQPGDKGDQPVVSVRFQHVRKRCRGGLRALAVGVAGQGTGCQV